MRQHNGFVSIPLPTMMLLLGFVAPSNDINQTCLKQCRNNVIDEGHNLCILTTLLICLCVMSLVRGNARAFLLVHFKNANCAQ
jgi:hypothetical protein